MAENHKVCIICNECTTNKLLQNADMLQELTRCCNERLTLGQGDIKPLTDRLNNMTESELKTLYYHSECRKPIVNKTLLEKLRGKRTRSDSPAVYTRREPGHTSVTDCARPKRQKSTPEEEVCLFSSCNFCPNDTSEPLHQVATDDMGEKLLKIKDKTASDCVRICVSDLRDVGDAAKLGKYYHRKCLRSAQRTFAPTDSSDVVSSVCDEQLLLCVQNTLTNDDTALTMTQVNRLYLSILHRYEAPISQTKNYHRHLKRLITERIPNVQFVKPVRKNESEKIVLPSTVSKAMELLSGMLEDDDNTFRQIQNIADILRQDIMNNRKWSFNDNFKDFKNPPLLQFFLTNLLFGRYVHTVSERRNEVVDSCVDVACQFLIQNTRSDRQVKHQPKKNYGFEQTVQTPLSIGLPLAIHSRVRDRQLVSNLSDVYIGSDYHTILDLEKCLEQSVLQRMRENGGFCLPDFVKKGVNVWFAIDNIDLLEDTPTGQNTFHGTVVVINQREEDGEPINKPLIIQDKHSSAPLRLDVRYLQEPVIQTKPIKFEDFQLAQRNSLLSNHFTRIWALVQYFACGDNKISNTNDISQGKEQECLQDAELQEGSAVSQTIEECDTSVVSIKERKQNVMKRPKEEVIPTWAGTKSLLLSHSSQSPCATNCEVLAPLFKTSPTDYATLYTVLMLTQNISTFVVGPERRTLITLDLDLYQRALHIQQSVGNNNWILRAGILHIAFAALHALGKTIDASGIDICAIDSDTYTSAALRRIYSGKAYKRGVEYHITNSLAIMMMKYDALSCLLPTETLSSKCAAFAKALHERSPDMVTIYDDIELLYVENCKAVEEDKESGELAQFFTQYLEQVDSLLNLISTCRSGDWEGYLAALENLIKYFFAHDLLNYARLMPVHLAQMNALQNEDRATWEALKSGDFVVAKSEIPFTRLFTDQALEQEIKGLKRHGGIVGISQDANALDRLLTTTPHLARMVKQYLNGFPEASASSERSEHYQLVGDASRRLRENALKIKHSIEKHCGGNPFATKSPLKNLASSALIPDNAKDDILHFAQKGQKRFEEFIHDRLLPSSTVSVWDTLKKLKLRTFSNCVEKTKLRVGDKVIKLREERELLGRFLIIQGSRPELVPKLEEAIGEYEMSVVPRSLCAVDGSLYIPGDKAALMHGVEEAKGQTLSSVTLLDAEKEAPSTRVLIVDAMAVLQTMKKTPNMKKLADLEEAFVKRIERMMNDYNEGRVVFDCYLDQSLKNMTRQKRATTSTLFEIHREMKLTMSIKDLLSASRSKRSLTIMFAKSLLDHFSCNSTFKLVVVYDNKIKGHDFEEDHSHEEADTLIPYQVLASLSDDAWREVCVWSPDTDVLILLVDLVSKQRLGAQSRLKFLTGKGSKYREIDVVERVQMIGPEKCQGLIGLHNFTGADWGGKFVGISKKTWVSAYMKLAEDDPAITCFQQLGEGCIPTELIDGELPPQIRDLEAFVCRVYCSTGPKTLPLLRWELFRSKNMEGEMLPPTRAALLPHITRANYIAMRDKSYCTNNPVLPPVEENGWTMEHNVYTPVKCLTPPAPQAVLELRKCGCKKGCQEMKCSCMKNGLPCTPLCKCYASGCSTRV